MKNKSISALRVPYAQAVHGKEEEHKVIKVLREHRTIMGQEVGEFEKRVAKFFGKRFGAMVNSGSSANLLAFESLDLPEGSEVITPILTFSTTVSPIIQKRLVPVFVDVEEGKYTIDVSKVEKLITKKTKAIIIPLLLGNVPDLGALKKIAKKNKLIFIEDSCDTFAASFKGIPTGKYSDMTTTSFYGSHIITAGGGGGMLLTDDPVLQEKFLILRGWGRRSSILGESESIEKRFNKKIGRISYDAKFIFDDPGYNFLPMEIGAAFGNAQLDKITTFKKSRKSNFNSIYKFFEKYESYFTLPVQDERVDTAWLAFPITIKKTAPFSRIDITKYFEQNNIQTRPVFTGNILRQPGFEKIPHKGNIDEFPVADEIMERGFVIGCHQGLKKEHLEKIKNVLDNFIEKFV